jgi:hypothetical protein
VRKRKGGAKIKSSKAKEITKNKTRLPSKRGKKGKGRKKLKQFTARREKEETKHKRGAKNQSAFIPHSAGL